MECVLSMSMIDLPRTSPDSVDVLRVRVGVAHSQLSIRKIRGGSVDTGGILLNSDRMMLMHRSGLVNNDCRLFPCVLI